MHTVTIKLTGNHTGLFTVTTNQQFSSAILYQSVIDVLR